MIGTVKYGDDAGFTGQTADAEHVFGLRGGQHVDGVVDGDDAEHLVIGGDDWQREEVVTAEVTRRFFGGGSRQDRLRLTLHELLDLRAGLLHDDLSQARHADQAVGRIGHVDVGDGFVAFVRPAQKRDDFGRRHVLIDLDELARHQTAGAVLRIVQQIADFFGRGRVHLRKDFVLPIFQLVGQNLDQIVHLHAMQQASSDRRGHALEQFTGGVPADFDEDIGGDIRLKLAEDCVPFGGIVKPFENVGDILRILIGQQDPQFLEMAVLEQFKHALVEVIGREVDHFCRKGFEILHQPAPFLPLGAPVQRVAARSSARSERQHLPHYPVEHTGAAASYGPAARTSPIAVFDCSC